MDKHNLYNISRIEYGITNTFDNFYIASTCGANFDNYVLSVTSHGLTFGYNDFHNENEWIPMLALHEYFIKDVTIYMGNLPASQIFFPQGDFPQTGFDLIGIISATTSGGNNSTFAVMLDGYIQSTNHVWSRGYVFGNNNAENITVTLRLLYKKQ